MVRAAGRAENRWLHRTKQVSPPPAASWDSLLQLSIHIWCVCIMCAVSIHHSRRRPWKTAGAGMTHRPAHWLQLRLPRAGWPVYHHQTRLVWAVDRSSQAPATRDWPRHHGCRGQSWALRPVATARLGYSGLSQPMVAG